MRRSARLPGLTAVLATAFWPLAALPVFAGEGPVEPGPVFIPRLTVDPGPVFTPPSAATPPGDPEGTVERVVNEIYLGRDYCGWIQQKEYVVDCLSDELNRAADMLPDTGEYASAKAALKSASRQLSDVVAANESATLKPGVARSSDPANPRTSTRPLRAVETGKLDEVTAAAIGIIEETGTILLRSSSQSEAAEGFVAISTAVRSNTVLLRSL